MGAHVCICVDFYEFDVPKFMQFYQRQLQHMFFFFGVARALFKPNINESTRWPEQIQKGGMS